MRADAIWGIVMAAVVGALLVIAYQPREVTIFSQADNMFWPRRVLWPLLVCALLLAGSALFRKDRQVARQEPEIDVRALSKPFLLAIGCGVAILLVDVIGFLLVTFVFSAAALMFLGRHGVMAGFTLGSIVSLIVWSVFLKGLAVPLPRGIGPFRELSFLLY